MKILAFCFFPAYTPPSSGGESRLFNFYRHLSLFHSVTLLTSAGPNDPEETIHHGAGFIERRIPKDEYFMRQWQVLSPLGSGGDLSAPCLAASGRSPTRLHRAYLEEYDEADVIIHDFPFTIDYDLFLGLDNKLRVYNAHNCESRLYSSLHPAEKSEPIQQLVRDVERRLLNQVDVLLYCSHDDLADLQQLSEGASFEAVYAPHGIEPLRLTRPALRHDRPFRAFFIGSGHPPNKVAATFIVEKLAASLPHVQFDIVGHCLPEGTYPANVHRHGAVDEPTKVALMSQADIALNPMQEGSGANIKVLDYLSASLPVLSTSFGMRGVHANETTDYVCAVLDDFAATLGALSRDRERCVRIGQAGYHFVQESYTWAGIAKKIADVISASAMRKAGGGPVRYVLALNDYDSFASVSGGGTRTKGIYHAVSEWRPVVFLCFSNTAQLEVRRYASGITVITVPKASDQVQKQAWYAARFPISVDDVVASYYCTENAFLNAIYRVLRKWTSSVVVEHCYMLPLPVQYGDRFIYSSHNNETQLKTALLRGHPEECDLIERVEKLERYAVENAALVVCVSQDDASSLMVGKAASGPTLVIRNGAAQPADPDFVRAEREKFVVPVGSRSVVFLGSAHGPNSDAARQLVRDVVPHCPNVQFHFVGSVCTAIQSKHKNVYLWGEVSEAKKCAILQSCGVALNPVVSGGGSNIKLADYIANGLYVITTEFGLRGYPDALQRHVYTAALTSFPQAIEQCLDDVALHTDIAKQTRQADFRRYLSMKGLSTHLTHRLQNIETSRKRILVVVPRYVSASVNDHDAYRQRIVTGLARSGHFDVDVIAPACSDITHAFTFSQSYSLDPSCSAPVDIPNIRFARFSLSSPDDQDTHRALSNIWEAQLKFEQKLSDVLVTQDGVQEGLTWGWSEPQKQETAVVRWAMSACAIRVAHHTRVVLRGYAQKKMSIAVSNNGVLIEHRAVSDHFTLELEAQAGELVLTSSSAQANDDPRPLGFMLTALAVGNKQIDVETNTCLASALGKLNTHEKIRLLDRVASETRQHVSLTQCRGPWSRGMDAFIKDHISSYDLVIVCDSSLRSSAYAIGEAYRHAVPSVLISEIDLEDEHYHFPDVRKVERLAQRVLVPSDAMASFLQEKGCHADAFPSSESTRYALEEKIVRLCLDIAMPKVSQ